MTKLEKLMFLIGVKDEATTKMGKLQKNLTTLKSHAAGIAGGLAGAGAAGYGLYKAVGPAVDLNRALGEVASLGVGEASLAMLQKSAGKFASEYGGTAADVVRASYDIQSAIAGLNGKELAAFTTSGAVLAKATKANVGTITNYMGTMYGIYEADAEKMGKARWVEQLAGRTAYAVQIFKTTGDNMSAAFTALGAKAQSAGIDAAEQMAVLGTLQATMGGSEAGTKYKAFLSGVGQAQKELGLQFTDAKDNMLGMTEILDKIRGKFGDEISVDEGDMLKKAFGSDEAVALINLLLPKTKALKGSIKELGQINGMEKAEEMARKQTDGFMRVSGAINYLSASFMQKLLPPLNYVADKLAGLFFWIVQLTDQFPTLSSAIGYVVVGLVTFIGAISLFSALKSAIALVKLLTLSSKLLGGTAVIESGKIGILRLACTALGGGLKAAASHALAFSAGLIKMGIAAMSNPIVWIVIGVMALIAGVVALIFYWDNLVAAFKNSSWGKAILVEVDNIIYKFQWLIDLVKEFFSFGDATTEATIKTTHQYAGGHANPISVAGDNVWADKPKPVMPNSLDAQRVVNVPQGGLSASYRNTTQNNGVSVGTQNFYMENPPADVGEFMRLAAG